MENINLVAVIIVFVVISLVYSLSRYYLRRGRMRSKGVPAKAVVTSVSLDTRLRVSMSTSDYMTAPRKQYLHQLSYSVNGRAYTGSYVSYTARNVGDEIDVFCDPDNPNDMMLAQNPGSGAKKGASVVIVVAALVVIVIVFVVVAAAFVRFGK